MSAYDLRDVSVGDAIAVMGGGFHSRSCVKRTVTRVTATQVVLNDGSRWLRKGRKVGANSWTHEYAKPWDEAESAEIAAEIHAAAERNYLMAFFQRQSNCALLTVEQRATVIAICKEAESRQT